MLPQEQLVNLAREAALRHHLDPKLVCAVCEEESGKRNAPIGQLEYWDPFAVRFEPDFLHRYVHPALPQAPTTEEICRAMSWGVMQVMGQVARERGFVGRYLSELLEPAVCLEYGCRHLSNKIALAHSDVVKGLLLWNGGADSGYPTRVELRMMKYA